MKCPGCQSEVEGRFCGYCGAALEPLRCSACDSVVPAGFRFCGQCGLEQSAHVTPAAGATPAAGSPERSQVVPAEAAATEGSPERRKWWIVGVAVTLAVLFLSVPYVWTGWTEGGGDAPRMPMSSSAAFPAPGSASGVDLSTMTPREAADRLFDRVMRAQGAGDEAELATFLPMAIDAYRLVPDLDADGHFHLALLQQATGNHRAALATAERLLADEPDHLLALYAAGEAARGMGDVEQARNHFRHLLNVYDAQAARTLAEYREHQRFLPTVRETAEEYLAAGGP